MPDGPACQIWTPEDVRRWLVAAFIALPTTPVYSKPGGRIGTVSNKLPDATFDWIGLVNATLKKYELRLAVLIWARCEARREAKARKLNIEVPAAAISEFCREWGWSRKTFDNRVKAAVALLARERSRMSGEIEMQEAA